MYLYFVSVHVCVCVVCACVHALVRTSHLWTQQLLPGCHNACVYVYSLPAVSLPSAQCAMIVTMMQWWLPSNNNKNEYRGHVGDVEEAAHCFMQELHIRGLLG